MKCEWLIVIENLEYVPVSDIFPLFTNLIWSKIVTLVTQFEWINQSLEYKQIQPQLVSYQLR